MRAYSGTLVLRVGGRKALAVFHRPSGPDGRRFPAVLFLHGFPGAEKSVDVQRELLRRGIASFAPHFQGAWGSEGTYRFGSLHAQSRAFLRAMRALDFVDSRRLAVFGFSMGGWAALNLAAAEPALKAVAALAPVGGPEMLGPLTRRRLAELSRPLRAPAPAALYADFTRAVSSRDPGRAVRRLRAPLLLLHGDADQIVPLAISRRLMALASGPVRLKVERGAAHDFLDRREKLARYVADWLRANIMSRSSKIART